jgi:hypothetical protein
MTDVSAAVMTLFGLVAAIFGAFSDDFYASMMGPKKKKLPKWFGKLWFFGFSVIMLCVALSHWIWRGAASR